MEKIITTGRDVIMGQPSGPEPSKTYQEIVLMFKCFANMFS